MGQELFNYRIAILGRQNAGKSSLLNQLLGRTIARTDGKDKSGTPDPFGAFADLDELGKVLLVEVPALEAVAESHPEMMPRVRRSYYNADLALLVTTSNRGLEETEKEMVAELKSLAVPFVVVINVTEGTDWDPHAAPEHESVLVNCTTGTGIPRLRKLIIEKCLHARRTDTLIADLVHPDRVTMLILPGARGQEDATSGQLQGRLALEILDQGGLVLIAAPDETQLALRNLSHPPDMVITNSQFLPRVASVIPENTRLTTLAVLFARLKADLATLISGARFVDELTPDSRVLILDADPEHPTPRELLLNKIPSWLEAKAGGPLDFVRSGAELPGEPLESFDLVVHCGGDELDRKQLDYRIRSIAATGTPVVTLGMLIAHLHGLLDRITCFLVAQETRTASLREPSRID